MILRFMTEYSICRDNVELYNYINKVFMDDLMSLMVQVCFHHD